MTITASDDGGFIPEISSLAGGPSSFESDERIQEATVRNLVSSSSQCDPWASLLTGPPRRGLGLIYVRQSLR